MAFLKPFFITLVVSVGIIKINSVSLSNPLNQLTGSQLISKLQCLVNNTVPAQSQYAYNCTPKDGSCAISYPNGKTLAELLEIQNENNNGDAKLNTSALLNKYLYFTEEHLVTTQDGYQMVMFRIPRGYNKSSGPFNKLGTVIIQHGLLCSSDDWLAQDLSNGQALPQILANAGYDVWLANNRGNKYGLKHLFLTINQLAFWNFSFHEMGLYDVPAMIALALNKTGDDQVTWIGHSEGTTQYFIATSLNATINKSVKGFYALSPIVYVQHVKGVAAALAKVALFDDPAIFLTHGELNINTTSLGIVTQGCSYTVPAQIACSSFFYLLGGFDFCNTYCAKVYDVISKTPTSTSTKNLFHYLQMVNSGKFRQYDTRKVNSLNCDLVESTSEAPLNYNLSNFNTPAMLFVGGRDWLGTIPDITRLINELKGYPNPSTIQCEYIQMYNHLDFTYAINANTNVYEKIRDSMQSGIAINNCSFTNT